ncbi:DNA-binding protein HEXBP [Amphibalanus amphitrite]|uniref:DNA-binding protein HEXBP n=1 Tax=Amphibalanus amphitrite TaxID=1232801 RepID=A0A6A4WU84_AMPAM|nr:DNA-binding protein HEXBP [Amphibalanus amphitrite]
MNSTGLSIPAVEPFRQGDDFGRWLRGVERYLCAVGIQEADRKCAVLLHLVGPDVADLSETLPEETSETADSFERLTPHGEADGLPMEPEEDLERFLGRLRAQVVRCGYAATEVDRELRDRCVLGSRADLRAKLVKLAASKGDGLTLAEVRQTARAHRDMEQLGAQLGGTRLAEAPAADAEGAVNAVRSPQSRLGTCFRCGAAGHWQRDCPAAGAVPRARDSHRVRDSHRPAGRAASGGRVGTTGARGQAGTPDRKSSDGPVRLRRCFKCGSTGHLKAACPQRRVRLVAAEEEQTDGDGDAWLVSSVGGDAWLVNSVEARAAEPEMKTVTVNGQQLAMVMDTGSPVSLVSAETARQRGLLQQLDPCDLRLTSFTGQAIPLRGEALDMRLADTMSRLSVPDEAENRLSAEEEAAYGGGGVMFIAEQGPCLTAQQIAVATRRDPVLARALAAVRSGWPAVVDPDLAPFKNRREELTTEADCLLWGGRVVIPSNLRDTVKRELHEGHFGCTRMKQLARRFVWR